MPLRYWLCPGLSLDANALGLRRWTLLVWHVSPTQSGDEDAGINIQTGRDLDDIVKTQVARTALDLTDESPVHLGELRKSFLADSESKAFGANPFAKNPGGLGFRFAHGS
jgi:hypothetical protein